MREVNAKQITEVVKKMCIDGNYYLTEDVLKALDEGERKEESPVGKEVFQQIKENVRIAREEQVAICQDTGLAVLFIELGQEVHIIGGNFNEAIHEGVRQGYKEGYLRKSSCHPFTRVNTKDNTPAIIHLSLVPGDKIKIVLAPKGGGRREHVHGDYAQPFGWNRGGQEPGGGMGQTGRFQPLSAGRRGSWRGGDF
jgi:fumarate hydratase subunit alpha